MRILIVYYSESGNTENIANSIYGGINDEHEKSIFNIKEFIHRRIYPDENEFKEYIDKSELHPDIHDIQNARAFAINIVSTLEGALP